MWIALVYSGFGSYALQWNVLQLAIQSAVFSVEVGSGWKLYIVFVILKCPGI